MASIRTRLGVLACKSTRTLVRKLGKGGGTALPGKVAMRFDPRILEAVSRDMDVVIVTGTNGKTTTCGLLRQCFEAAGIPVAANTSGANLLSGVTAELVCEADGAGHARKPVAVIECDEGALKQVTPLVHPKVLVVTNLFRDQLDRYGEVMNVLKSLQKGVEGSPETTLVLNADCSMTSSLADSAKGKVMYFGLDMPVGPQDRGIDTDATHCVKCGGEYEYEYHTYAHLGGFYCPHCGYRRQRPQVAVTKILGTGMDGTDVRMRFDEETADAHIALPATYNLYNAAAALAAWEAMGRDRGEMLELLSKAKSSFGRMESFELGGKRIRMILIKNPAGTDQALEYVSSVTEPYDLALSLNDHIADGTDISWIWDANFEQLSESRSLRRIYAGGLRRDDLVLRLKHAGIPEERIVLAESDEAMAQSIIDDDLPVFALPNYTAMLFLREQLGQAAGRKEYWA